MVGSTAACSLLPGVPQPLACWAHFYSFLLPHPPWPVSRVHSLKLSLQKHYLNNFTYVYSFSCHLNDDNSQIHIFKPNLFSKTPSQPCPGWLSPRSHPHMRRLWVWFLIRAYTSEPNRFRLKSFLIVSSSAPKSILSPGTIGATSWISLQSIIHSSSDPTATAIEKLLFVSGTFPGQFLYQRVLSKIQIQYFRF